MTSASDLARLLKAKRSGPGWIARCPAHDDHRESLSIGEGENGKLLLKCHAGCTFDQIIKTAGIEPPRTNGEDRGTTRPKRRIVATYDYRDAHEELVFQVIRFAPKDFRQRRPDGNGGWIWSRGDTPPLPYRLSALLNANEIYVCEGEKDCDNLAKLGLVATTNPGGADADDEAGRKWPMGFGRYFEGRHVVLIPDNDDAGHRHVQAVATKLHGKAASIRILQLPDLPPRGDVSDWLDAGGTRDRLEELAAETPYWEPAETGQVNDTSPPQSAKANGATAGKKRAAGAAQQQNNTGTQQNKASVQAVAAIGLSEHELALEFTRRHGAHFRYVASWGRWMKWTGCRWQHEPTQEVFDLARKVCADAGKGLIDPKVRARILSASTRAAVENLARSDRAHAAVTEQWDRDPFALNEPRSVP